MRNLRRSLASWKNIQDKTLVQGYDKSYITKIKFVVQMLQIVKKLIQTNRNFKFGPRWPLLFSELWFRWINSFVTTHRRFLHKQIN